MNTIEEDRILRFPGALSPEEDLLNFDAETGAMATAVQDAMRKTAKSGYATNAQVWQWSDDLLTICNRMAQAHHQRTWGERNET